MIQRQNRSSTEIAKGRVSINKSCPGPELFALTNFIYQTDLENDRETLLNHFN